MALLINTFFISFIIKHNLIFFYGGGGRVGTTTEDPWKMCVDFIFLLRSSLEYEARNVYLKGIFHFHYVKRN